MQKFETNINEFFFQTARTRSVLHNFLEQSMLTRKDNIKRRGIQLKYLPLETFQLQNIE